MANMMGLLSNAIIGAGAVICVCLLFRRQDDPLVRDHDPGAQARRRRSHRGRAHPATLFWTAEPGARHQPRAVHALLGPERRSGRCPSAPTSRRRGGARPPHSTSRGSTSCHSLLLVSLVSSLPASSPSLQGSRRCSPGSWHRSPQWDAVKALVDNPSLEESWPPPSRPSTRRMATGFVSNSGVEAIDALLPPEVAWPACLTRSGFVLGALSFADGHGVRRPPLPSVCLARSWPVPVDADRSSLPSTRAGSD